ncbi:MAG: ATP-dependent DNA ligase [Candidatus Nanohaloarchaea archaeon]|nr:ATP-dependent DNA ligase [Candidatus Nanohaloarchaea archaeon]
MKYSALVEVFNRLNATQANLEKTDILAEALSDASTEDLPLITRFCRGKIFASWDDREIGMSSSLAKEAISKTTGASDDDIDDAWRETGDLGDAAASLMEQSRQDLSQFVQDESADLTVQEIYDTFETIEQAEGEGSVDRKVSELASLLNRADPDEARYIVRLAVGAMRLGVGEGTVRDALAKAFIPEIDPDEAEAMVEHAYDVTNDFGLVARALKEDGEEGLNDLELELFRPIKVMLAQKSESMEEGFEDVADEDGVAALEAKYDGMRTQIHKQGDEIRVFTRRLEDVTKQFPDLVQAVEEHIDADECIIEGEAVAYDPDDHSQVPFQTMSKRIKRKYDIEQMVEEIPVVLHLFDITYLDGEGLLDEPLRDRLSRLDSILDPEDWVIDRAEHLETDDLDRANDFYQRILSQGHEGIMLKNLDAAYKPGSRVGYMVKLKPIMETLDLVAVRAKWSEGRKSDWLGRLFLACRDEDGELLEVGRMSTGFTDEELADLTERLEDLIIEEDGREVTLQPEVVIEVAYEEIQESPKYGSGYALRFPRFIQVREDLSVEEADSLAKVESLYRDQADT